MGVLKASWGAFIRAASLPSSNGLKHGHFIRGGVTPLLPFTVVYAPFKAMLQCTSVRACILLWEEWHTVNGWI